MQALGILKNKRVAAVVLSVLLALLGGICYLASLFAASSELTVVPGNKFDNTLIVVADIEYEPYSFYNGSKRPSGYDIEFIYAIAEKMRFNVDIRLMNWADCISAIMRGEADVIMGLDYQVGELSGILRSVATSNDLFVSFGREDFADLHDLYDKKLATIEASGCISKFLQPYRLMENTTFYPTYTKALQSVINGENDYAIVRYSVGRSILAGLGKRNIRAVGPFVANNANCVGLSANNECLLDAMNGAIQELKQDGTVKRLTDKWLGRYVEIINFRDFMRVYRGWIVTTTGVMLLALTAVIVYIYSANHSKILKEKELELTQGRMAIMLSQIQPHFLYNSLASIQRLCIKDPKLAEETVAEFSRYLRGNMDSLSVKEPISFEKELFHVENYLSIEKKRFGERLNVVYEIFVRNFSIPALTLQPIVENAVRHGVTKREEGGTVTIRADETSKEIVITVTDDGVGFDPGERKDNRQHIGIENVRHRLAAMCGGTLTVQGEPGVGTTAVITLPKELTS